MRKARFYIYRNLHKENTFSVRYKGRIVAHLDKFVAYNCEMKVNSGGYNRCIKEKQKNVHAFVVAEYFTKVWLDDPITIWPLNLELTYNPYRCPNFICHGNIIKSANKIFFNAGKAYILDGQ